MRNIIGSPVEGDDFFNPPQILSKLRQELDAQANILLVAPLRVGKTSLVSRLCDLWRSDHQRKAVFVNVEGRSDEFAFAEKIIDELAKAQLKPEALARATQVFSEIRRGLGGAGLNVLGLEVSLGAEQRQRRLLSHSLILIRNRLLDGGDDRILRLVPCRDPLASASRSRKAEDDCGRSAHVYIRVIEGRYQGREDIRPGPGRMAPSVAAEARRSRASRALARHPASGSPAARLRAGSNSSARRRPRRRCASDAAPEVAVRSAKLRPLFRRRDEDIELRGTIFRGAKGDDGKRLTFGGY
jgi:hypothetical protein